MDLITVVIIGVVVAATGVLNPQSKDIEDDPGGWVLENLFVFLKYCINLHSWNIWRAERPLIFNPDNNIKKKGKEKINFPPMVNINAKNKDRITAFFFRNCAIFLLLVFANQFSIK